MKDAGKFGDDLRQIAKRSENIVLAKLYSAALIVQGEAQKSIQEQKFGNSTIRYTAGGNPYPHIAAPEGGAPNTDTGNLVKNIIAEKRGKDVVVGSSEAAPYGKWLEVGNEKGQKWPWLKPAFMRKKETIRKILNSVGVELVKGN